MNLLFSHFLSVPFSQYGIMSLSIWECFVYAFMAPRNYAIAGTFGSTYPQHDKSIHSLCIQVMILHQLSFLLSSIVQTTFLGKFDVSCTWRQYGTRFHRWNHCSYHWCIWFIVSYMKPMQHACGLMDYKLCIRINCSTHSVHGKYSWCLDQSQGMLLTRWFGAYLRIIARNLWNATRL